MAEEDLHVPPTLNQDVYDLIIDCLRNDPPSLSAQTETITLYCMCNATNARFVNPFVRNHPEGQRLPLPSQN